MKQMLRVSVTCLIVAIACVGVLAVDADAQTYTASRPGGRAGTWDFFMPLSYNPAWDYDGFSGAKANLDATWGFGFGFGYNFSDHFQLNGLFSWSARNYTATLSSVTPVPGQPAKYSNTEYSSTFSINGIFYILPGNVSPFVTAGAGLTYVDTGIPTGFGGGTTCWWDPWYGYVCGSSYPTKTETDVSYSLGLGIRFDLSRQFSLQPSYNRAWLEINNSTSGTPSFDIYRLDFIFRM